MASRIFGPHNTGFNFLGIHIGATTEVFNDTTSGKSVPESLNVVLTSPTGSSSTINNVANGQAASVPVLNAVTVTGRVDDCRTIPGSGNAPELVRIQVHASSRRNRSDRPHTGSGQRTNRRLRCDHPDQCSRARRAPSLAYKVTPRCWRLDETDRAVRRVWAALCPRSRHHFVHPSGALGYVQSRTPRPKIVAMLGTLPVLTQMGVEHTLNKQLQSALSLKGLQAGFRPQGGRISGLYSSPLSVHNCAMLEIARISDTFQRLLIRGWRGRPRREGAADTS
jgi:hypothetical protein